MLLSKDIVEARIKDVTEAFFNAITDILSHRMTLSERS